MLLPVYVKFLSLCPAAGCPQSVFHKVEQGTSYNIPVAGSEIRFGADHAQEF